MRLRFSLFTKILGWFFVNLLILGGVLFAFFNLYFRFNPASLLWGESGNRIEAIAHLISIESGGKTREERDALLSRYSSAYQVDFLLYTNTGEKLAGKEMNLPAEVARRLADPGPSGGRPPRGQPPSEGEFPPHEPGERSRRPGGPPPYAPDERPEHFPRFNGPMTGPPRRSHPPVFSLQTFDPTRYWGGARVMVFDQGRPEPIRSVLIASSDSMTGHGLFFDPTPWLIILSIVGILSILLWLPFVRSMTRTVAQMTAATEQIAEEHFDVTVNDKRSDELGRLGKAINHLAVRLSGFVTGQKRFLGDISHELNSPLARMQFALGILEERGEPAHRGYVEDAQEEVRLMSNLVSELLTFSRAGIRTSEIRPEKVALGQLARQVIEREAADGADIRVKIDETLEVMAVPGLLSRALANVIRNAVRYAGAAGPITVSAGRQDGRVQVVVADCGPGVPDEALGKLFDPFFRLQPDRSRSTGGTGLGLAIVKTCVESCQGTVTARNRMPSGLEIIITLNTGVSDLKLSSQSPEGH